MTYLVPFTRSTPSIFDDFFGEDFLPRVQFPREIERALSPRCDLHEDDENVFLEIEAPGIPADRLDIQVDENSVSVSGRIETTDETKKGRRVLRSERAAGSFVRSFRIPAVDPAKVTAEARDGVVTVTMPKAAPKAKKITVRVK